jgi:DNA-binding PadR family transcriptional regulator
MGLLYQAPSHGYELHQRLHERFGYIWHSSQSQSYNILKRLEMQGFISSTRKNQEKLPPRQQLQLTSSGKQRFLEWLNQPTNSSVHAIRVEFITRLYFMQLYFPDRTKKMIHDQAELVRSDASRLRELLENQTAGEPINRLALELRLELLDSVVKWLDGSNWPFAQTKIDG